MTPVPESGAADDRDRYNPIFETFVGKIDGDDQDLTSLVAYSLYKKAKVQWTLKIKQSKGRAPTPDELTAYYVTWTPVQIEAFRDRAQSSLAAFGESVVQDAKPTILAEALQGSFWKDIWRAMFASFLYTLLLIGVVLVLRWQNVDLLELLHKASPGKSGAG